MASQPELPKAFFIIPIIFMGAFILVPVGLAAPEAFPIVAGFFIPFLSLAAIMILVVTKKRPEQNNILKVKKRNVNTTKTSIIANNTTIPEKQDDMEINICPYCGIDVKRGQKICHNCQSLLS